MKKRILSMLLAICLCGGALPTGARAKAPDQYGLTVDDTGMFRLNGKPFYGYGVNGTPGDIWQNPFDETYAECLRVCQKYEIPFIRMPLTYGTVEEYQQYQEDPDSFFIAAKQMLDMAQEARIGVIVWILNSQRYTSMLGEKASSQGDLNSKSMAFMRKLVKDFVTRFKDHPALWGWEIRNEGNLEADLPVDESSYGGVHQAVYGGPVGEVNGFDSKTSEEFMVLYREAAKAIREVDSYRMISNGNAVMRESAYHLHQASQKKNAAHEWTVDWTKDTVEQFCYMNEYLTPDPVDTISTHIGMPLDGYTYALADKTLTYEELLKEYVNLAKKNKKGFYFGEFGSMAADASTLDPALVQEVVPKNLEAMVNAGVQLASMWQRNGNNAYITDEGNLSFMLAEIQKVNQKFKALGLQNTDDYWASVPKDTTSSDQGSSSAAPKPPSSTVPPASSSADSSAPAGPADVDSYMLSSSTKLTISDADNTITIEKPVTFDVFKRSIALKEGYTMNVLSGDGTLVTEDDTMVDSSCIAVVFDPAGAELRRFAIVVADTVSVSSNEGSAPSVDSGGKPGGPGWLPWVITVLAVLALGGGGFSFYYFYLRKRLALKKEAPHQEDDKK